MPFVVNEALVPSTMWGERRIRVVAVRPVDHTVVAVQPPVEKREPRCAANPSSLLLAKMHLRAGSWMDLATPVLFWVANGVVYPCQ